MIGRQPWEGVEVWEVLNRLERCLTVDALLMVPGDLRCGSGVHLDCRMERAGRTRISDISNERRADRRGDSVKENRNCRERTNGFPIPDDIPEYRF